MRQAFPRHQPARTAKLSGIDLDEGGPKISLDANRHRLVAKRGKAISAGCQRVEPADNKAFPALVAHT